MSPSRSQRGLKIGVGRPVDGLRAMQLFNPGKTGWPLDATRLSGKAEFGLGFAHVATNHLPGKGFFHAQGPHLLLGCLEIPWHGIVSWGMAFGVPLKQKESCPPLNLSKWETSLHVGAISILLVG